MKDSGTTRTKTMAVMVLMAMLCVSAAVNVPVIGTLVLSFSAIPAFVTLQAWGVTWFIGYSAVILTLTGFIAGSGTAAVMVPLILVPAVLLFIALKMGMQPLRAVIVALLSATLFSTGIWNLYGDVLIKPVKEEITKQMTVFENQLNEGIQKTAKVSTEVVENARANFRAFREYTFLIVPATVLFIWHLITLAVIYAAAQPMSKKLNYKLEPFPSFKMWRFDWQVIWLFIIGWSLFHLIGKHSFTLSSILLTIGANCLAMSSIIYFIAGLSLLFFMFDKFKIGSFTRVSLSCLALIFTQAVIWFGIIDIWADLRTPRPALTIPDDSDF